MRTRWIGALLIALVLAAQPIGAVYSPYAGGCDIDCMNSFPHDVWLFATCYTGKLWGCFTG